MNRRYFNEANEASINCRKRFDYANWNYIIDLTLNLW